MTAPTNWLRELRHSWPLLRGGLPSEITTVPLPLSFGSAEARIGIDGIGVRHLLVPVLDDDEVQADNLEGVLAVRIRTYTFGRQPLRYLDLVCGRSDLFDLFDEVLVDVLEALQTSPSGPARTSLGVIGRWRSLLETRRARLLTLVGQMSLFGELTVLDLVTRDRNLDISWWRGPLREPQDILLPGCALEIKAIGPSSSSVEIHGVQQLEPPGVPLALVLITVTEDDAGVRLPDLVEQLVVRTSDRGETLRRLAAAGYSTADSDRYQERFAVTAFAHVEVTGAVPRIVPQSFSTGTVPQGIDGVNYRIELDALDPFVARGEAALLSWVGVTA